MYFLSEMLLKPNPTGKNLFYARKFQIKMNIMTLMAVLSVDFFILLNLNNFLYLAGTRGSVNLRRN